MLTYGDTNNTCICICVVRTEGVGRVQQDTRLSLHTTCHQQTDHCLHTDLYALLHTHTHVYMYTHVDTDRQTDRQTVTRSVINRRRILCAQRHGGRGRDNNSGDGVGERQPVVYTSVDGVGWDSNKATG